MSDSGQGASRGAFDALGRTAQAAAQKAQAAAQTAVKAGAAAGAAAGKNSGSSAKSPAPKSPSSKSASPAAGQTKSGQTLGQGAGASAGQQQLAGSGATTTKVPASRNPAAVRKAAQAGQVGSEPVRKPRQARLRLVQVDAWSVMKTAFLLSLALGIVTVVAVSIIWMVLSAAGVFDSVNTMVRTVMGNSFDVTDYLGTGRIMGFTMVVAVVDVILLTAIATLAAFLYNLAATLLGGVELTLAEDQR